MVRREEFISAVMSCVKTPVRHMGRTIGVGLDCVGVPIAALAAVGGSQIETGLYSVIPEPAVLRDQLVKHARSVGVEHGQPGDILVALWKGAPRHVIVYVDQDKAGRMRGVHARGQSGVVVYQSLTRGFRIVECWRLREVTS